MPQCYVTEFLYPRIQVPKEDAREGLQTKEIALYFKYFHYFQINRSSLHI